MVNMKEDLIGKELGDYVLDEFIGSGAISTVFKAHHKEMPNTPVAVKVFNETTKLEKFKQEAAALDGLLHEHIIKVHDVSFDSEHPYIALEYAEESLRDKMDKGPKIWWEEAVKIAAEIGTALDYAHTNGVCHRDVKPENILFVNGKAKLSDFNSAQTTPLASLEEFAEDVKLRESLLSRVTINGDNVFLGGTPGYMPPEQFEKNETTAKSDTYSLGAVLYEMLMSQTPTIGCTKLSLCDNPKWLDELEQKALIGDPEKRQSMGDFVNYLNDGLKGKFNLKPELKPEPEPEKAPGKSSETSWLIGLAATGLLVIGASNFIHDPQGDNAERIETAIEAREGRFASELLGRYSGDGLEEETRVELELEVKKLNRQLDYEKSPKGIFDKIRESKGKDKIELCKKYLVHSYDFQRDFVIKTLNETQISLLSESLEKKAGFEDVYDGLLVLNEILETYDSEKNGLAKTVPASFLIQLEEYKKNEELPAGYGLQVDDKVQIKGKLQGWYQGFYNERQSLFPDGSKGTIINFEELGKEAIVKFEKKTPLNWVNEWRSLKKYWKAYKTKNLAKYHLDELILVKPLSAVQKERLDTQIGYLKAKVGK